MKLVKFAMFALSMGLFVASCGDSANNEETTVVDSTTLITPTPEVAPIDTTTALPADTTIVVDTTVVPH